MKKGLILNIGKEVISSLKLQLSDIEYNRYFKNIRFNEITSTDDIYNYEVDNVFILKWIQNKYLSVMQEKIEQKVKRKIKVNICKKGEISNIAEKHTSTVNKTKESFIINPSFLFDNFVVGQSNEFAFVSAKKISQKPGKLYNPLFLYGGVGLGKTHLLQAIGNASIDKGLNILYLSTEQLMNDFTKHLVSQTMNKFKEKYRNCDMLLIDDVQFLAGKEVFQEEFFHTFNELYNNNKQIVLTSDKKPSSIKGLQERLQSRFEWGLLTNIQPPDLETKIGIIKKKCELDGISLTNDIILYIATHLETNIREIEGILIKINAYASLINLDSITIDFTKNILKEHIQEKKQQIDIEDIVKVVSMELNIKPSEIVSKKRSKTVTHARRIVIYLAIELTKNSMSSLARYFDMKDHSTISHSKKKMIQVLKENKEEEIMFQEIRNKIVNFKF